MNILQHFFGLCGETHLNIYSFILLIILLYYSKNIIYKIWPGNK